MGWPQFLAWAATQGFKKALQAYFIKNLANVILKTAESKWNG